MLVFGANMHHQLGWKKKHIKERHWKLWNDCPIPGRVFGDFNRLEVSILYLDSTHGFYPANPVSLEHSVERHPLFTHGNPWLPFNGDPSKKSTQKKKTDHTPKKHLKVVLTCIIWNMLYPPPRNLTYIQVPKIAIFERRIHFLQGPWFLGYISKLNFGHVFCIPFNTFFHSGFRSLKKEQVSRCFHWATLRLGRSKSYVSNIQKNGNDLGGTNHQVTCLLGFWFIFTFPCCWEWWISKCIIGKNATTKW